MEQEQAAPQNDRPIWIPRNDSKRTCKYEKLLGETYRKHEIIVFFKSPPTNDDIAKVKESFREEGIDPNSIKVRKCDNCDIPIQLWQATNIHTIISADGVRAGSGPSTTTVGETYSLNFLNRIPADKKDGTGKYQISTGNTNEKRYKIIVAVLDTGIDTRLVDERFIWKSTEQKQDLPCYRDVTTGWNFINDSSDFSDDNPGRHGSIVSQFIINEFQKSPENSVQIMPLKTHDANGIGDLFAIICAIHFAIAKGANIINASWGFYYYFEMPIPYLKELITQTLKRSGILFVTASGNKVAADDDIARQIYFSLNGVPITDDQLRNLFIHNFYPAILSNDENSVITATTTDTKTVSPTQNYSNIYTDLGVVADKVLPGSMKFKVPFAGALPDDLISGSSFATAIATGVIGAYCKKGLFVPGIRKSDVFTYLASIGGTSGIPSLLFNTTVLEKKLIKKGAYTKKTA
jgi:hypothetical protein